MQIYVAWNVANPKKYQFKKLSEIEKLKLIKK